MTNECLARAMSTYGTKRTSTDWRPMSAFGASRSFAPKHVGGLARRSRSARPPIERTLSWKFLQSCGENCSSDSCKAPLSRRGIEPALPLAILIMFLELVGAICITIGFLTRPYALLLLIEMLFITFKVQVPNGWFFSAQGGGAEFTVMWAALFLIILIRGGGPHSVDRAIGKEF